MKTPEQAALDAVARRFAATWEAGENPARAYLSFRGKRIAVDVFEVRKPGEKASAGAKPRLRFDKVATRVLERVRKEVTDSVPPNAIVFLTITAPIRLASKTAASVAEKIKMHCQRRSLQRNGSYAIHGNHVIIRLLPEKSRQALKIIGFVHHAQSDPLFLLSITQEMLELFSAGAALPARNSGGDRWLLAISEQTSSCLPVYRYIYSQLRALSTYKKVLIAFRDEVVDILKE